MSEHMHAAINYRSNDTQEYVNVWAERSFDQYVNGSMRHGFKVTIDSLAGTPGWTIEAACHAVRAMLKSLEEEIQREEAARVEAERARQDELDKATPSPQEQAP